MRMIMDKIVMSYHAYDNEQIVVITCQSMCMIMKR